MVSPVPAQEYGDSVARDSVKPRAWLAAIENIGVTGLIMGYNNSVLSSSPFSKVTFSSMKHNLKDFKWWWDGDYMYTNTIEHPYHGSVYYLTARENGLGIGTSSIFAIGGSLVWELIGEAERPSYNDIITTPIGGVTLGEPLHRLSQAIIDDRARGLERVGRELLATIVNPMCGLNRLIRGESWRIRGGHRTDHLLSSSISVGYRYLTVREQPNLSTAYIDWHSTYGDVMGAEGNGLFDYFDLDFTAAIGSHQTILNYARVTSQLWRSNGAKKSKLESTWGVYNHFNSLYAEPEYDSDGAHKFRYCVGYSEVGSIGPGFAYRMSGPRFKWEQQFFLNGILLGATPMKLDNRDHQKLGYTWGSGYGAKAYSHLKSGQWLHVGFDAEFSHLFTWIGYQCQNSIDLKKVKTSDIQGEEGNALTFIGSPSLEIWPCRQVGIELRGRYVCHIFNYKYHQHTSRDYAEVMMGAVLRLSK